MEYIKLLLLFVVIGFYFLQVLAISQPNLNVKNTITEEERRGAPVDASSGKYKKDESGKNPRGAYSSSAATQKHQHYYYPSGYDSHIAATGHSFLGGGAGGGGGGGGGGGTGYEYSGHSGHSGHSSHHGSSGGHSQHGITGYGSISGYGGGGYGGIVTSEHGNSGHGSSGHGGSHGGGSLYGGGSHGQGGGGIYGGSSHGHGGGGGGGVFSGGHGGYNGALALKGLLIPLAGIALLGAAAALSTNPVLLQLGVVNGRRRRRSLDLQYARYYPANPHVKPNNHL